MSYRTSLLTTTEGGRPAYPLEAMLRVHLMQNWFGYSDPAMEEALYETTILRHIGGAANLITKIERVGSATFPSREVLSTAATCPIKCAQEEQVACE